MKTLVESKPSVLVILKARSLSTTQLTLPADLAVPLVVDVNFSGPLRLLKWLLRHSASLFPILPSHHLEPRSGKTWDADLLLRCST
jgi:hypothetical protein